jgi:bifunctional non-homologous end joining protein LigD
MTRTVDHDVVAGVRITHPARMLYDDPLITKLDLARYFEDVGEWILPHLAGRPLTLVRCPHGLGGGCVFMKHSKVWAPRPVRRVRIQEKTKLGEYLIADTLPAVIGLVQMGILEIHTWNSTFPDVDRPDRLVIDLDPGDEVTWSRIVAAARTVRAVLAALDLECFVKTTGGRGLHVVVPLTPHAGWAECLTFARHLSQALERTDSQTFTTTYARVGRRDKILLDYLRNNRTNTSIAAYSVRARAHAPVSVPIAWEELRRTLRPERLTVSTVRARLGKLKGDPWTDYWRCRQKLTVQRLRAVSSTQP